MVNYLRKKVIKRALINDNKNKINDKVLVFEYKNHVTNSKLLKDDIRSSMTLNSGATVIEKGDELNQRLSMSWKN